MTTGSAIAWTDHTWNPWQGCTRTGFEGCRQCYMYREKRRWGQEPSEVVRSSSSTFRKPLSPRWEAGSMVFTSSWTDFCHRAADPWREEARGIMEQRTDLVFQVLTKRGGRLDLCLPPEWLERNPHVWVGHSASTQEELDLAVRYLESSRARCVFLSLEPLLERVDVGIALERLQRGGRELWVIVGSESGLHRRHTADAWVQDVVGRCAGRCSVFVKQLDREGRPVLEDDPSWPSWAVQQLPVEWLAWR